MAHAETADEEEAGRAGGREAALRAELTALKLSELKKRARGTGLTEDDVDEVDGADNPKVSEGRLGYVLFYFLFSFAKLL